MQKKRMLVCLLIAALFSGTLAWKQPILTYAAGEGNVAEAAENPSLETPEGTESVPEGTPESGTESAPEDVPERGMETNVLESRELSLETTFPDVGLRVAVSVYDADQSGSLNEMELKSATALISPNTPIANLAGLEKLVYLNYVDLSNTGLTDYTPITTLTNLTALKLDGNNAAGLDVRGAKNLQTLSCKTVD